MTTIDGETATGFEPVREAFAANFDQHGEVGAAVFIAVMTEASRQAGESRIPHHWRSMNAVRSSRHVRRTPHSAGACGVPLRMSNCAKPSRLGMARLG